MDGEGDEEGRVGAVMASTDFVLSSSWSYARSRVPLEHFFYSELSPVSIRKWPWFLEHVLIWPRILPYGLARPAKTAILSSVNLFAKPRPTRLTCNSNVLGIRIRQKRSKSPKQ
jgi:hypothetical protein